MPIKIRKIRNKNLYTVKDADGRVFAKGTTKDKAIKQKFAIERSVGEDNRVRQAVKKNIRSRATKRKNK